MLDIIARLGRVFGWLGNGLAVVMLLFGVSIAYENLSRAWSPKTDVAREFTRTDGLHVVVVGPYDNTYSQYVEGGASGAAERFLPNNRFIGPKSIWQVFPAVGRTPEQEAAYATAYYQQQDESAAVVRSRAIDDTESALGLVLVIATLLALIGNALRYVLAGSLWKGQHA